MFLTRLARMSTLTLVVGSLAVAPAFAAGNGNGGGNGGGDGGSHSESHENSSSKSSESSKSSKSSHESMSKSEHETHKKSASGEAGEKEKAAMKASPSDLGKLNGFLHASPQALKKASPNSSIGLVTHGYADALTSYLSGGQSAKTAADVYAALQAASNKPLTVATIEAVDAKLAKTDPALATAISSYPGGAKALAKEIAAAGPAKKASMTKPAPAKKVQ